MSPLRWTTKSTRNLAADFARQRHRASTDMVGDLLREEGFGLQANAKSIEGSQSPDRDAQFRYLNEQAREHRDAGQPVISVDTKKKELVGEFKNSGRQWRPTGEPVPVNVHDFADPQLGKAVPYGIYDLAADTGWVNVGTDHDAAAFAVESIRRWWHGQGQAAYPQPARLLITADAGGSNGYRTRAWKLELAGSPPKPGALHPQPCPAVPAARAPQAPAPQWDQALLSDPALTGMSSHNWTSSHGLWPSMAMSGAAVRPGSPSPNRSWPPCSVCGSPWPLNLAVLFGSSRTAMRRTLLKNRKLLEAHGIVIPPATTPPVVLAALRARVLTQTGEPHNKIKTTCQ
jgi:hypothetical protein